MASDLQVTTDRAIALKDVLSMRDYAMHKQWLTGVTVKVLAKRYSLVVRTVNKRLRAIEAEYGAERMKDDIYEGLLGMSGESLSTVKFHLKNRSLEAALNILRHLGMGQGGTDSEFVEITDEEMFIEEQTEMRQILAKHNGANGNGSANGGGTPVSLSTTTTRTRSRKKAVRKTKARKA